MDKIMPNQYIQDIIANWVATLPGDLINNLGTLRSDNLDNNMKALEETLNPILADAGYKAEVKALSLGFNKIIRLKIENTSEPVDLEEIKNEEIEEPFNYCLSIENLEMYIEPDVRTELANKENEAAAHLAPVYASNQTNAYRASLLPFYKDGTLDDKISFATYFDAASEESLDLDRYITLCSLKNIQNQYFKQHNNVAFTPEVMYAAGRYREFSYESINTAMHLYELAEKKAEINKKLEGSNSPGKKIMSALRGRRSSEELNVEEEKKHINNFFDSLIESVQTALRDYPEKDAEIKDLINDLQAHLPNQESGNFLRNTRASLDYFNNAISKFIDNIQFEADLGMVMENQQKVLLPVAIDVMRCADDFERNDIQYWDWKAPNIFMTEGQLVFTDTKTLTQRQNDKVSFGLGHMTYRAPDSEMYQQTGESVDIEWAKGLAKFQIGLMLYEMTLGWTGMTESLNTPHLLNIGIIKELDFDYPCFKTNTGQILEKQIKALTDLDPAKRPDFSKVQEALITFTTENEMIRQHQEDISHLFEPSDLEMLSCPIQTNHQAPLTIKEKFKTVKVEEETITNEEKATPVEKSIIRPKQ